MLSILLLKCIFAVNCKTKTVAAWQTAIRTKQTKKGHSEVILMSFSKQPANWPPPPLYQYQWEKFQERIAIDCLGNLLSRTFFRKLINYIVCVIPANPFLMLLQSSLFHCSSFLHFSVANKKKTWKQWKTCQQTYLETDWLVILEENMKILFKMNFINIFQ